MVHGWPMLEKVQLLVDLWQVFVGIAIFIVGGIVRVELLAWRIRALEKSMDQKDKEIYALRVELQTVDSTVLKELAEIRESLAWLKGKFSVFEDGHHK